MLNSGIVGERHADDAAALFDGAGDDPHHAVEKPVGRVVAEDDDLLTDGWIRRFEAQCGAATLVELVAVVVEGADVLKARINHQTAWSGDQKVVTQAVVTRLLALA